MLMAIPVRKDAVRRPGPASIIMNHLARVKRCHSSEAADSKIIGGRNMWSLDAKMAVRKNRAKFSKNIIQ